MASTSTWLPCLKVELPASKMETWMASASVPKLLQMLLLSELPPTSWPVEAASQLPQASIAKCMLMKVMEQLAQASSPQYKLPVVMVEE
jgi:hypothetical protein